MTEEIKIFLRDLEKNVRAYMEKYDEIRLTYFYGTEEKFFLMLGGENVIYVINEYGTRKAIRLSHVFNYEEWLPALKEKVEKENRSAELKALEDKRLKEQEELAMLKYLKEKYERQLL